MKRQETARGWRGENALYNRGEKGRGVCPSGWDLRIEAGGRSTVPKAVPGTAPHPSPNQLDLESWWKMT